MLFDCCRAQADTAAGDVVPKDLSMLGKGKGKLGKYDKKGKGKRRKGEGNRDEKDKDKDTKANGKGKANAKAIEYFAGYCLLCKAHLGSALRPAAPGLGTHRQKCLSAPVVGIVLCHNHFHTSCSGTSRLPRNCAARHRTTGSNSA